MKCNVFRTSERSHNKPPCSGATRFEYPHKEIRTCTEEYFDKNFSHFEGKWRSKGHSHKVEGSGWISRIIPDEVEFAWVIDLNEVQIIDFVKEHGRCVISRSDVPDVDIEIEIYDGYRE